MTMSYNHQRHKDTTDLSDSYRQVFSDLNKEVNLIKFESHLNKTYYDKN